MFIYEVLREEPTYNSKNKQDMNINAMWNTW